MDRTRPQIVKTQDSPGPEDLQPNLVLPQENSDDHPLMRRYARFSEQALKNTPTDQQNDLSEDVHDKVG
jgi:hypothetical protein